jgi:transposase
MPTPPIPGTEVNSLSATRQIGDRLMMSSMSRIELGGPGPPTFQCGPEHALNRNIACLTKPIGLHANHLHRLTAAATSSAKFWLSASGSGLVRCNAVGLPIAAVLTEGEAHDVTAYDGLTGAADSDPGAMLMDKRYDGDAIRQDLRDRGSAPETKRNHKVQHSVSKRLYALRSRIECFIGHLKEQRRIGARYHKTETSFLGFVLLGALRQWICLSTRPGLVPIAPSFPVRSDLPSARVIRRRPAAAAVNS